MRWLTEDGVYTTDDADFKVYDDARKSRRDKEADGFKKASIDIGIMFDSGNAISQDYDEARKWYTMAARQGYAPAQYNLGTMFDAGKGVSRDHVRAYGWIDLAATQGLKEAQRTREVLAGAMTTQEITMARALSERV